MNQAPTVGKADQKDCTRVTQEERDAVKELADRVTRAPKGWYVLGWGDLYARVYPSPRG